MTQLLPNPSQYGDNWKSWASKLIQELGRVSTVSAVQLPTYAKASLPSSGQKGVMIYVLDDVGGEVPAFSDGTNWRRVTDRNIIS